MPLRREHPGSNIERDSNYDSQPCVEQEADPRKDEKCYSRVEGVFHPRVRPFDYQSALGYSREDQDYRPGPPNDPRDKNEDGNCPQDNEGANHRE